MWFTTVVLRLRTVIKERHKQAVVAHHSEVLEYVTSNLMIWDPASALDARLCVFGLDIASGNKRRRNLATI